MSDSPKFLASNRLCMRCTVSHYSEEDGLVVNQREFDLTTSIDIEEALIPGVVEKFCCELESLVKSFNSRSNANSNK